jgi:lipopolysaccharide transport system ATP-binding protein
MLQEKILETRNVQAEKPAIVVRNVTKEFIIPHERRTTIFENLRGVFSPSTYEKFVAIKDVSFTVNRGESVGIIGDNGSGKSTLLKIISRILRPTSGSIEINGRITPFLELGVGFQPDMTAKENIEVYSTIMGMSDKEIAGNLDHVLEFAGLTNFRDTKLKNFSSGMQVRLAFATAIQKEPDILLVDEVLAVGDMDFQQKCLDIFTEYKKKGITMLFVSHDLGSVRLFCDKTILMKNGQMLAYGNTLDIIDRYVYGIDKAEAQPHSTAEQPESLNTIKPFNDASENNTPDSDQKSEKKDRWGNQKIAITSVKLLDKYGGAGDRFNTGDSLKIRIEYHVNEPVQNPVFGMAIYNDNDLLCYGTNTDISGIRFETLDRDGYVEVNIPSIPLLSGKYLLTVAAHTTDHVPYDWHDKKYAFTIINTGRLAGIFNLGSEWNYG